MPRRGNRADSTVPQDRQPRHLPVNFLCHLEWIHVLVYAGSSARHMDKVHDRAWTQFQGEAMLIRFWQSDGQLPTDFFLFLHPHRGQIRCRQATHAANVPRGKTSMDWAGPSKLSAERTSQSQSRA